MTTDLSSTDGFNRNGSGDDISNTNYTQCMNGTSAASPNAAGVVALMLQANPSLSWRDVRRILATTARRLDMHMEWFQNGAGRWVNDQMVLVRWMRVLRWMRPEGDHVATIANGINPG